MDVVKGFGAPVHRDIYGTWSTVASGLVALVTGSQFFLFRWSHEMFPSPSKLSDMTLGDPQDVAVHNVRWYHLMIGSRLG
jgi:hypothetical protein